MPASLKGDLEIDGTLYDSRVVEFFPDFSRQGVRMSVQECLDFRRLISVQKIAAETPDTNQHFRKVAQQIFKIRIERASLDLRDHIETIHNLGKSFVIRVNDVMSRTLARCYDFGDLTTFFTPTWPIRPEGWEVGDAQVWTGAALVNGGAPPTTGTVYPETGTILFDAALASTDVVTMSYEWMATVMIDKALEVSAEDERYNLWKIDGHLLQAPLTGITTGYAL